MARPTNQKLSGNTLHAWFYGMLALIGVVAIVLLKLGGLPQFVVTLAPILVMLAYASLVAVPRYRVRSDQIGDNLYYLGFVFTLASLSTALVQFARGGAVEEIVSNFGIALLTTLVGVILRVAFNQVRMDPIETEREARLQLAEAARHLRRELTEATSEFSMAARVIRQSVADGVAEMQEQLAETLQDASEMLRQAMNDAAKKMVATGAELQGAVHSSSAKLTGASGRLAEAIDATTINVTAASATIKKDQIGFDEASLKLIGSVESLVERLDVALAPGDPIRTALDATTISLRNFNDATVKVGQDLETIAMQGAEIVSHTRRVSEDAMATARVAQQQVEVTSKASRIVEDASAIVASAERHPERISTSLDLLEAKLAASSERIAAELGAALAPGIAISHQANQFGGVIERLDLLIALMREQAVRHNQTEAIRRE